MAPQRGRISQMKAERISREIERLEEGTMHRAFKRIAGVSSLVGLFCSLSGNLFSNVLPEVLQRLFHPTIGSAIVYAVVPFLLGYFSSGRLGKILEDGFSRQIKLEEQLEKLSPDRYSRVKERGARYNVDLRSLLFSGAFVVFGTILYSSDWSSVFPSIDWNKVSPSVVAGLIATSSSWLGQFVGLFARKAFSQRSEEEERRRFWSDYYQRRRRKGKIIP